MSLLGWLAIAVGAGLSLLAFLAESIRARRLRWEYGLVGVLWFLFVVLAHVVIR